MKKILLALLLLGSTAYAVNVPQPTCVNGNIEYISQNHAYMDLCVNGFEVKTPQECNQIIYDLQIKGTFMNVAVKFFNKKELELCSK